MSPVGGHTQETLHRQSGAKCFSGFLPHRWPSQASTAEREASAWQQPCVLGHRRASALYLRSTVEHVHSMQDVLFRYSLRESLDLIH